MKVADWSKYYCNSPSACDLYEKPDLLFVSMPFVLACYNGLALQHSTDEKVPVRSIALMRSISWSGKRW